MDPVTEQALYHFGLFAKKGVPFVTELAFLAGSPELSLFTQFISASSSKDWGKYVDFKEQIKSLKPKPEFKSLYDQTLYLEKKINLQWKVILSFICQIICLVGSMDLDMEETKPESELISLIKKIIFLFNSKPDSESELVSLITQVMRLDVSVDMESDWELVSLIRKLVCLQPERWFEVLTKEIISHFKSMNWEPKKFISLCPQVEVELVREKFCTPTKNVHLMKKKKGECRFDSMQLFKYSKDHFYCGDCNGEYHEEYEKAPVESKHPVHPKHSLQLAFKQQSFGWRHCYCCDKSLFQIFYIADPYDIPNSAERLFQIFYYCEPCDFAMHINCMEKPPPDLSINNPKRHEHALALFPRRAFLNCNVCALPDASSLIYMCPPCDFVVHQKCLNLPRVIRISRHPHRIFFTPSFDKGNWVCGVCRKKVDNDYGSYSCTNDGCFYVVHSRCATQKNVWDGIELEGVPEEIEEAEEFEPFVKMRDGIIQHFSHQQHHLRLDELTSKNYDDNRQCQVCIAPIYFGNFYSCMECEFVIHEECANLPRKAYHPTHPHFLTLVANDPYYNEGICSVCPRSASTGFHYACFEGKCGYFSLHVQCATISEPLVHESHMHPLFLTSKPGEHRTCGICNGLDYWTRETFNCIECDFALCFACAGIPQKVRYKHDKHMLTLSYRKETSDIECWCEACETKIKPKEGFYKCDEYCCTTIHIECLIGRDFYMKPGLPWSSLETGCIEINVLPNNHRMSRPFCYECKKRCPQKILFEFLGLIFCSQSCSSNYLVETGIKQFVSTKTEVEFRCIFMKYFPQKFSLPSFFI